jgi:nicotinamide-nucleotide amidase
MSSHEEDPLAARVGERLRAAGLTLASAESSTGGLIAKRLTDCSGSSAFLMGGVIAYDDRVKQKLLGVAEAVLIEHGAVSEPVARQMAEGARALFEVDLAVSVTGIAGPTGATARKPVGLHYIGISTPRGTRVQRHQWAGDRAANRQAAADAALQLVLNYLDESP